jgi:hypothetical protein
MTQKVKTTGQIDTDMICSVCSKPAIVVENKIYYCADCMLKIQKRRERHEHISFTRRSKDMR